MKDTQLQNPEFQGHLQQYGQYLKTMNYAPVTVQSAPNLMAELLAWLEGQNVQELPTAPQPIEHFMLHLKQRPNRRFKGKGLSEGHRAKYWQAIRNFDLYLRHSGQGGLTLPERDIENTPVNKRNIGTILSQAEITQLYNACDTSSPYGLRDRAMLSIFYGCGLRRNEGLTLKVNDVRFSDGLLHVRHGKGSKQRYVPMGKQVAEDLQVYMQQGRAYLLRPDRPTDTVLVSQRGLTPTGDTLKIRLKLLQAQSGDPVLKSKKMGLHLLRHSIATHLLEQGMSLKRIAAFLGHTHLESTQVYTHLANSGVVTHGNL